MKTINDLEESLKTQLASLADEIRSSEENLMRRKEGYLKVQGALEAVGILKNQIENEEKDRLAAALTVPGVE